MKPTIAPALAFTSRPFQSEDDFWQIRRLSIATYPNSGPGWNWDLRRWDGSRFYGADPALNPDWQRSIRLWETGEGQLAGAANEDGAGFFFLQIDPDYRAIEEEMIAWAEEHLAADLPDGTGRQIETEVHEYDAPRQRILTRRGYEKQAYGGVHRKMHLGKLPVPPACLAEGYRLRAVRASNLDDCQRIADLLNAAFKRTFHNAMEYYQFARLAPCYREDFHLVAEAPDGSFAAHVAVIYDEENRRGFFEPVCTHPQHLRKHLAQSLMFEGLGLLKAAGAREVTVETGDMIPANALYDSIGFSEVYKTFCWKKIIT
jgi:mycothiol synthase